MVESIGAVLGDPVLATEQTAIGQEDFLRLLLTQLTFQDPLEPLDNREIVTQLAQFTNLEQTRQLNEDLDSLLTLQSATQSLGILGRTVEFAADAATVVGTVNTVRFVDGIPQLTVLTSDGDVFDGIGLSAISVVR